MSILASIGGIAGSVLLSCLKALITEKLFTELFIMAGEQLAKSTKNKYDDKLIEELKAKKGL